MQQLLFRFLKITSELHLATAYFISFDARAVDIFIL
jgi:hypothetical protein